MGCAHYREKDRKINVLLIGLDNSGKSTLLYSLEGNEDLEPYDPTDNTQHYTIERAGTTLDFIEIGGHAKLRPLWLDNLILSDTIFYFIDTSDPQRLEEALTELKRIIADPITGAYPIFVFCNKIDKGYKVNEDELNKQLDPVLAEHQGHHKVYFVSCYRQDILDETMNDIVKHFYPSCVMFQPKRISVGKV